jgi:integrase
MKEGHFQPSAKCSFAVICGRLSFLTIRESRYVFTSPKRPDKPIRNPQKALERIQKATGIDFVGHDLRRTAASHMTGMGIPRFTVKKILNHVEREVTAVYDRYFYDTEKREALEAWSKRLQVLVSDLHEVKTEA